MAKAFVDPKLLPKSNLQKAKWESSNEGVHERVNFDDTIWGFDLAGGSKYGTPLRVTKVFVVFIHFMFILYLRYKLIIEIEF